MFNKQEDGKQLTLDFEPVQVEDCTASAIPVNPIRTLGPSRLELVVNNHSVAARLRPDSVEITRILANQAKTLGW